MTLSLLLCDDSALARKQLAKVIPDSENIQIFFAANGEEALAIIAQRHIDLMFLDLTMPVMDGYQTLDALRQRNISLPVIVVSADIQPEAQRRVNQLGASGFISKPVNRDTVDAILRDFAQELAKPLVAPTTTPQPRLQRREIYNEVANIAIGRGASALAQHFDVFVKLPLPNVNIFEVAELHMTLRDLMENETIAGVCQGFSGEGIAGEALVLISDSSVDELCHLLKRNGESEANRSELLTDVSNIMVGAFLSGIGEQCDVRFQQSFPILIGEHIGVDVLIERTHGFWRRTMAFEVSYQIEDTLIKCELLILFVDESLPLLDNKLAYLLED
uniref:response regulator n=1 Tax=Thaumasiovibrio occultus TaxID=1891184 RepID=UPI000B34C434|nr:response regulator [Thaumasiovibrio occultus]